MTASEPAPPRPLGRLAAIDWMRGFVMVLMTIDHASMAFNRERFALDSVYPVDMITGGGWVAGMELPTLQFVVRWITHLCAPTFLFLSGTSLALSLEKRRGEAMSERELDRHLAIRGLVILGCEAFISTMATFPIFQVLYAIGLGLLLMIPLRRLGTPVLVGLGIAWFAVGEWIVNMVVPFGSVGPMPLRLLFAPGISDAAIVMYPVTGWLAMMMIGWGFGRWLLERSSSASSPTEFLDTSASRCALGGVAALALFLLVRGIDGYGNMGLHRDDASLLQWLHVSKYPPALAYAALELGIMALCLAVAFAVEARLTTEASRWNPLRLFGQTALVYYMLHFIGLPASAMITTGGTMKAGMTETWISTVAVLVLLYPVCARWRRYKSAHPRGWAQYV